MNSVKSFADSMKGEEKIKVKPVNQQSFLMAMNLMEHKYYVYKENGILVNRIDYSDWVEEFGEPVATSENGLNFLFKKKNSFEVSIIHFDEQCLTHIKTFDIMKQVRDFIKK